MAPRFLGAEVPSVFIFLIVLRDASARFQIPRHGWQADAEHHDEAATDESGIERDVVRLARR